MANEYRRVRLKSKRDRRVQSGHLWIFSNEIRDGFQECEPGSLVWVEDDHDRPVGTGTCNPHSLITVRLFSRELTVIDESFLQDRLAAAVRLRERVFGSEPRFCRLFYSESDGLPGLIIDRYDEVLVVQSNTAGVDRLLPEICRVLERLLKPRAMVLALDAPVRRLEGLELSRKIACGAVDGPHRIEQDGVVLMVDLLGGQKTGFYYDQRLNRRLAASFVRPGDQVLDLFCYSGAFGLYALNAGAARVVFVDASEEALSLCRQNVELNGLQARAEFVKADAFQWLKHVHDLYDVVILDPPALAKSRSKVPEALRGYRDLNASAMRLVKAGSTLVTASCSGLVQVDSWYETLIKSARKTGRNLRFLATGTQAPDHPVLAVMPETGYLKCLVAAVD